MGSEKRDRYVADKRKHKRARLGREAMERAQAGHATRMAARRDRGRYELITAPGAVGVRSHNYVGFRRAGATRGVILGWSARSKRMLFFVIASILWPSSKFVFLTLTYPEVFPRDPADAKRQLRTFQKAWERRFGKAQALWVLEFQRRGAPHFHIVLVAPDMPLPLLRRWYAATWHRIVTGCTSTHERDGDLGAGCVPWHYERHLADEHCKAATSTREAVTYLTRELGKESQKSLPAYLEEQGKGAGRWWGVWNLERRVLSRALHTRREFLTVRSAIIRIGRVVERQEHERREALRQWRLAHGRSWTARPKPSGNWLVPRSDNHGITVMDPELRPELFARAIDELLDALRRGSDPFDVVGATLIAFGFEQPVQLATGAAG